MVFAFITVVITVHAYVFYSIYVVNGDSLRQAVGTTSVLAAVRTIGGIYMFGRVMPVWSVVLVEFCFAYFMECVYGSPLSFRPVSAYDASRKWLNQHGLEKVDLYCLNKYGRDNFLKGSSFNLELEDYYKMHFDLAVEDSSVAFKFFDHLPDLKVMVFDRPWNQTCTFPNPNYKRCTGWEMINELVGKLD